MTRIEAPNIQGIMPGLDPKQIQQPFVIDGKNFRLTLRGPRTAFGGFLYARRKWANPGYVQSIKIEDNFYFFAQDGIYFRDALTRLFYPIYLFSSAAVENCPWTTAYVGSKYYFAKKGMNIIQFDPIADTWQEITTDVATGPVAVTQAAGRLIILAQSVVQWSAIDDGEDLALDPDKGVGAQLLALVGNGAPLTVRETPEGFVTYTDRGVMYSQTLSSGVLPFRHRKVSSITIPLSAYAVVDIDQQVHVVFSRHGLFVVSGPSAEAWRPLFSEHLRTRWVPQLQQVELFFDDVGQFLYISLSTSTQVGTYSKAFVNYLAKENAWGSLDIPHTGLVETDDGVALLQTDGSMILFDDSYAREEFPTDITTHMLSTPIVLAASGQYYRSVAFSNVLNPDDYPSENVFVHSAKDVEYISFDRYPEIPYINLWHQAFTDGYFFTDETGWDNTQYVSAAQAGAGFFESIPAVHDPELTDLDSYFTVGLFRLLGEEYADRGSILHTVVVGTEPVVADVSEIVDYQELEGNEDWNALDGTEDWGVFGTAVEPYGFTLYSTYDGYELEPANGTLYRESESLSIFYCTVFNYYFAVKISADEVYSGAELRMLEFGSALGRRV